MNSLCTKQQRPPLYKGQNIVPQRCPLQVPLYINCFMSRQPLINNTEGTVYDFIYTYTLDNWRRGYIHNNYCHAIATC